MEFLPQESAPIDEFQHSIADVGLHPIDFANRLRC
jgi:hypothetical protein